MTKNRIAAIAGGVAASLAVLVGAYDVSAATSPDASSASTTSSTTTSGTSGTSVTSVSSGGSAQATTAGS